MPKHLDDSEELDELFRQVGFIVVQWGQAEQSLDLAIATIYQCYATQKRPKRMPKMLDTKLKYLESCVRDIRELSPYRAAADGLVADFRRLSGLRHDLIHGAITDTEAENGMFTFAKLDVKKDFHFLRQVRLDGAEMPGIRRELIDLGAKAVTLARRIWQDFQNDALA
jgi:hypothetical protein